MAAPSFSAWKERAMTHILCTLMSILEHPDEYLIAEHEGELYLVRRPLDASL